MGRVAYLGLAFGLALPLAGCASDPADDRQAFGAFSPAPSSVGSLANPNARPLAALPGGAGGVLNVLEQRGTNFITQDIILSGDVPSFGENKISLTVITARTNEFVEGKPGQIDLKRPTDVALYEEVTDLFPDVAMNVSPNYDRNGIGPFAYAIGKSKSVTCLYAWQYVEDTERQAGFFGDKSAPGARPIAVAKVRLCKQGLGEQALLGFVRQLVIFQPNATGAYSASTGYGSQGYSPFASGDALAVAGGGYGAPYAGVGYNRPSGGSGATRPLVITSDDEPRRVAKPRKKRVAQRQMAQRPVGYVPAANRPLAYQRPLASYSAPQAAQVGSALIIPAVARQPARAAGPVPGGYAPVPLPE